MTLEQVAGLVRRFEHFVLASHDGPDADGLGAAYALALTLEGIGKEACLLLTEPAPAKLAFIDRRGYFARIHEGDRLPYDPASTCAIIVDTHDFDYLGPRMEGLVRQAAAIILLDHHELKNADESLLCVDPTASSTCELVWRLAGLLGTSLPLDAAEAVFAGIVYDTGSFAYPKTSATTFACALELVRAGVNPYAIHNRVYESASIGALLLQKTVLGSLELTLDARLAFQLLLQTDLRAAGAVYEDAEDLVNIPLKSASIEVSILIKENEGGKFRCSLRSKGGVNVARIAQAFGGGGHRSAAGFTSSAPLGELKEALQKGIGTALTKQAL